VALAVSVYVERKPPSSQQDEACQRACDPAVAILEWMDLCKTMVKKGGLNLRRDVLILVFEMHLDQPIHLAGHLLGRTVHVGRSVRAPRIGRQPLVRTMQERHLNEPP